MERWCNHILLLLMALFLSNCATIIGGSEYNAHVLVKHHPKARIYYHGLDRGTGQTYFNVKRKNIKRFSVTVKEDYCDDQSFNFYSTSLRGWALVGSIIFTYPVGAGILPVGAIVDVASGSCWKPNVKMDNRITKIDYKNYLYELDYTGCDAKDYINVKKNVISKTGFSELNEAFDERELKKDELHRSKN